MFMRSKKPTFCYDAFLSEDHMFKRFFLFFLTNIAIVFTVSLLLQIFHVTPYLNRMGIDYRALLAFCLIWGMTGAIISLLMSRIMAKWMLGVRLISANSYNMTEKMLYDMVAKLARDARLKEIPEVGIFPSEEPNAFATGPSQSRSLVAVSMGLLKTMNEEELEGVLGHEIAHIANGDMVTMTLLQGIVNAFVMFLSRVLAFFVSNALASRDKDGKSNFSYLTFSLFTFLFEITFMILGSMVIAYASRIREFKADKGSCELLGKKPMLAALKKLQKLQGITDPEIKTQSVEALMITSSKKKSFLHLFSTHPPLSERIERIETERF
jgi:heat shock protein HtpX